MQWTVRVTVALLNVAWIAFFLTPDPFSAFVQRRSSSEEEALFGEFCIHVVKEGHVVPVSEADILTLDESLTVSTTPGNRLTAPAPAVEPHTKIPDCCFTYYPRRIPTKVIRSYYVTDNHCPKTAVIFVTMRSRHICVDPSQPWVENIMRSLDENSL